MANQGLNESEYLAWFLGPKGENSRYFEEILNDIFRDYVHWRKNYFPEDDLLISKSQQKKPEFEKQIDSLYNNVYEMMGHLKRNFPFYSPRYLAHMLSDITMPSMLAYFAGMLFNANNVTSEASPVAAEWEIQASNALIKMIGYERSPKPPDAKDYHKTDPKSWKKLYENLQKEFAWGHITTGGTISNIEALWVARNVKYLPLGLLEACMIIKNGDYETKKAGGKISFNVDAISEFKGIDFEKLKIDSRYKKNIELHILNLPTNSAINILQKFYDCIELILINTDGLEEKPYIKNKNINLNEKIKAGLYLLSLTAYYKNFPKLMSDYPPYIFASCTAHYSINKAADVLGIPRNNVIKIDVNHAFRMDINHLKNELQNIKNDNLNGLYKIPLVVVGVCGTTEEGAVDPIHEIINLRKHFEKNENISFWIHADAAYGGFFSTLLTIDENAKLHFHKEKLFEYLSNCFYEFKPKRQSQQAVKDTIGSLLENEHATLDEKLKKLITWQIEQDMGERISYEKEEIFNGIIELELQNEFESAREKFRSLEHFFASEKRLTHRYAWNDEQYEKELLKTYIRSGGKLKISHSGDNAVNIEINFDWGDESVIQSFQNIKYVDSVTIDPHKMGYVQYPCGFVAFKNDKVRNFIKQGAPYITSSKANELDHQAPRHLEEINMGKLKNGTPPCNEEKYKIAIDAFAPYILEGSKPAAAAASLWLTTKVIKLDIHNYGQIIINSIRAANELYYRMINWDNIKKNPSNDPSNYKIIVLTDSPPDTNVVVFFIKPILENSLPITLNEINKATKKVYNRFHISSEHGDRKTSYSQEFFISQTVMDGETYNISSLNQIKMKEAIFNYDDFESDYNELGLIILRMAVMNPYVYPYKTQKGLNLIDKFLKELDVAMKTQ